MGSKDRFHSTETLPQDYTLSILEDQGLKGQAHGLKVIEQHNQIQRHAHHVWIITLPQYMFVVHTMFTSVVPYVLSSSELGDSKLIVIRCYQLSPKR